jgi:redox-sensitive bicupin YhaK (pirin superfamily)
VLRLVASRDARDDSVRLHQDVDLYATLLGPGDAVTHALRPGRHAWVHLARGRCTLNGQPLEAGDGAAVRGEASLAIADGQDAELLLFDLA